jgi:hypothetical protein
MEASSVTDANSGCNYLSEIEAEVQASADSMSVEVLLLLINHLENKLHLELEADKFNAFRALNAYVSLKVSFHHLKRRYDNSWDNENSKAEAQILNNVSMRVKDLRKKYYVAKRKYEPEHRNDCTCRGCKCIAGING